MAIFVAGEILKRTREEKGLTQKQVCSGICEIGTLSKIESGERTPSHFVFTRLMERLGRNPERYYMNATTVSEIEFINVHNEIYALLLHEKYDEADHLFPKLKKAGDLIKSTRGDIDTNINNKLIKQIILRDEATIALGKGIEPSNLFKIADKALSITLPDYNIGNISQYLLSNDEEDLFAILAEASSGLGETDEAIRIYESLITAINRYKTDEYEKSRAFVFMSFNLSNILGKLGRYHECIAICDKGISSCRKNRRYRSLPKLLFNKAYCLNKLDKNNKEYLELMAQALFCFKAYGNDINVKILEDYIYNDLNLHFNFTFENREDNTNLTQI